MDDDSATMTAIGFNEHGSTDNLDVLEVEKPEAGPGEVLVDIKATSLNHLDIFVVRELDHYVSQYPFWSGSDMAGVVAETGPRVDRWAAGDRVLIIPFLSCGECIYCQNEEGHLCQNHVTLGEQQRGGFAEFITVPESNLVRVPADIKLTTASTVPIAGSTAYGALSRKADIHPHDKLLIVGATGGVGNFAVQLATKVFNVRELFATTSTEEKAEFLREQGVDHVINYTEEAFDRVIWNLTDKTGVDVVYNCVGGETWVPSMRSLKNGGRLITSGATAGPNPATEIRLIFVRQIDILGSSGDHRKGINQLLHYVWDGTVTPSIDATFPLTEYQRAYERMENRDLIGKVVLTQK